MWDGAPRSLLVAVHLAGVPPELLLALLQEVALDRLWKVVVSFRAVAHLLFNMTLPAQHVNVEEIFDCDVTIGGNGICRSTTEWERGAPASGDYSECPRLMGRTMGMTTVNSWLSELTSYFTPSPTQFDGAKSHEDAIEKRLDAALGVYRMFEIGSLRLTDREAVAHRSAMTKTFPSLPHSAGRAFEALRASLEDRPNLMVDRYREESTRSFKVGGKLRTMRVSSLRRPKVDTFFLSRALLRVVREDVDCKLLKRAIKMRQRREHKQRSN